MNLAFSAKTWNRLFYRSCCRIGDAALPRRCVACQQALDRRGATGMERFVCLSCHALVDNQAAVRCRRCGLALGPRPQAFGWVYCRHCRPLVAEGNSKPLECVVCSDYTAPFDQWITLLKYGNNPGLARFLGHWLGQTLLDSGRHLPDVLIPVPASTVKLRQRGYNQAALIAQHLGRAICRPTKRNWLIKTREAGPQADLDRAGRLRNLLNAFQASREIPPGLRIGLVDDVLTTGATTQSCIDALYKAGAEHITILAVCRTPE